MKKPELIVFAGPNGSGKSTISTPEWRIDPYTNADDLARETGLDNLSAAIQVDALRERCIQEGQSFTFETVLSTSNKLDMIRRAKEAGFFIRGYFILTCNPELNIARIRSRVQSGQHDVPADKVRSRYAKSLANIPEFLSLCDICHIYDNTESPFRICRKHKTSLDVYGNQIWAEDEIMNLILGQKVR